MKIGTKYKVAYNEGTHILYASGELMFEDSTFICINDFRDGKVFIGKSYISRMQEVSENGKSNQPSL